MAQQAPGGHWSASNPIPTIQKFVENLDRDKKDRDKQIDSEIHRRKEAKQDVGSTSDISSQEQEKIAKKHTREVTDPTTGNQIQIEDVGKEFMKEVQDPTVSIYLFVS
jgi:hypothetical protein